MSIHQETMQRLAGILNVTVAAGALLSRYTRFAIGGPAEIYAETANENSFIDALRVARSSGLPYVVIGGGSNLIVSDDGFPGIVLRFTASAIENEGTLLRAQAGAELQALVDYSIDHGLKGIETMTGIPGWVGAAVYGNAGAYGHSINERIREVRFFDGSAIRSFTNSECQFRYRESVFKQHKDWIIFSADLSMDQAPAEELLKIAGDILKIRLEKYPVTMKCAGSIFKNLILAELSESVQRQVPARVIREGKVPSAYFLEEIGAKGMRNGDIRVADYHANLIYNDGQGTARELREVIADLKARVAERFGLMLEEEVQYVGFGA
jgi:UDP-N-acetylmuramate dehydrogenase